MKAPRLWHVAYPYGRAAAQSLPPASSTASFELVLPLAKPFAIASCSALCTSGSAALDAALSASSSDAALNALEELAV